MAQIVSLILKWFDWRDLLRYIAAQTPREVYRDRYLKSVRWLVIRTCRKHLALGVCQGCRVRWGNQAHHLTYVNKNKPGIENWLPELMDTMWLCEECHRRAHNK